MDLLMNFFSSNLEILEITSFVLFFIVLFSFLAKQVVLVMLFGIIAFNGYYFSMMSEKSKMNVKSYIQKVLDVKNDYVAKTNVLDLLSPNTKKILEEKNIKDVNQLNDYLNKTFSNQAITEIKDISKNKNLNVKDEVKIFEQEQLLRKSKEK